MNAKTPTSMKDKDEKEPASASKASPTESPASKKSDGPTGKEHWGEGGSFLIDKTGRRVRKPTPKQE